MMSTMSDSERTVQCCNYKNSFDLNISDVRYSFQRSWVKTKKFSHRVFGASSLRRGAGVNVQDDNGYTPLHQACLNGHRLAVVQHLLQVRPQLVDQYRYPACRNVIFTSTPLHRASKNGRKDVVTALIDAGMDPNVRTHSGTPLHEAARFGKPSVVRILLNKGADLHAQDSSRKTVYDLLAEYPEEATRKVRKVIRGMFQAEYENLMGNFDSDKELPPFPVQDYSPDAVM
ncbi:hypothetical protein HF086_011596 [Spodoptera exigua]|uniref:Uncharacterized protein n=1 Tax=Spodoptera exigua TaxID=7107 RepID=A0A922SE36_SPOEX|nr:hypothetical protein HF086_011596 [Spodoptera exigua]